VVDDGSGPLGRAAVDGLDRRGLARVVRRQKNGGKGAAVKTGLRFAEGLGYSHALQVDADGQHAIDDVPRFLAAARAAPDALVLGAPTFDASAPAARLVGRKITQFWTNVETFGRVIHDPMCGFRVYPIAAAIAADARGDAMDFDPEIAVRMVWGGAPVINLETRVRYLPAREGGVSHFRLVLDNARISWMHARLVAAAIRRLLTGRAAPTPRPRELSP
jgi:polyprenyl-phospho-N-acetylgalactosaminyl synthase